MIKKIWFRNYGPFEEAKLALEPLTVIVGPNASGKSIALNALHRFKRAAAKNEAIATVLEPMRKVGSEPDHVEVGLTTQSTGGEVMWRAPTKIPSNARSVKEKLKHLPETVLLRLEPDTLRKASYLPWEEPRMREDGYGLATVLSDMKLSGNHFESILDQTRAIVPTFEDLRVKREKVDKEHVGFGLTFNMKGAPNLPPAAVSDGTMLVLGLLTLLVGYPKQEEKSLLFLIDEMEHGLHPKALGELVLHLRRLASESDIQILATSHSPYLVDWLKPEEVRITSLLEDGSAVIRELGDHPEFDRWKEEMKPGEFWSTVGEDWS